MNRWARVRTVLLALLMGVAVGVLMLNVLFFFHWRYL